MAKHFPESGWPESGLAWRLRALANAPTPIDSSPADWPTAPTVPRTSHDGAPTRSAREVENSRGGDAAEAAGLTVREDFSVASPATGTSAERAARQAQARVLAADIRTRVGQLVSLDYQVATEICSATTIFGRQDQPRRSVRRDRARAGRRCRSRQLLIRVTPGHNEGAGRVIRFSIVPAADNPVASWLNKGIGQIFADNLDSRLPTRPTQPGLVAF